MVSKQATFLTGYLWHVVVNGDDDSRNHPCHILACWCASAADGEYVYLGMPYLPQTLPYTSLTQYTATPNNISASSASSL